MTFKMDQTLVSKIFKKKF